jgi:histone H3/H4
MEYWFKELFVEFLAKETYAFTSQGSRKTIQRKDIGLFITLNKS